VADTIIRNLVVAGRSSIDISPAPGTHVEIQDAGVTLNGHGDYAHFIATRQQATPGSKIEATEALDGLLESPLIRVPELGGGAVNCAVELARLAADRRRPRMLNVHLFVENHVSERLSALGDRNGFEVGFGQLSRMPVNLVLSLNANRTIVKSPLSPPWPIKSFAPFTRFEPVLKNAAGVVLASPASPALAAAVMALGNGSLRVAQPTGAMDVASTVLVLRSTDDLVVSFDDLTKLGSQTGYRFDQSVSESAPDAPGVALRLLSHLHDRGIGGSLSAVVTLGKRGCVVADWTRNTTRRIDLEYRESVPTKNGAGDKFLGAWVYFRVAGLQPMKAAVRATLKAIAFHDLADGQYALSLSSI
jgi:hypothetical protein